MRRWIKYETPTPPEELEVTMNEAAHPSFGFYILLALSACLATLGLIANSSSVIIGAMIIAPLMNPIIAHSFALTCFHRKIWLKSTFAMITGTVLVLVVSGSISLLVGYPIQGTEILSRANPNLIDLGVAIASGIAGAIAWSRSKIANALPGVAIAVALVPPLCAAGIGLAMGEVAINDPNAPDINEVSNVEWGALLLFMTNLGAIVVFGSIVFVVQGYGRLHRGSAWIVLPLVLMISLVFPLAKKFNQLSDRGDMLQVIRELAPKFPKWKNAHLLEYDLTELDGVVNVRLRIEAPSGAFGSEDRETIQATLEKRLQQEVEVEVHLIEYRLLRDITPLPPKDGARR